ncbi:uncharacterized protein LOC106557758 isoform X1 [Canis lupus familiaris]|uniref:uncharacterized protein LOC106557758 isoform X1 n=1 Tax=Canis lupus familiaris TaxID=9615 RepID=UPI0018F6A450|nr:uncharacterized protein LOC106557758 isoform X1 [Canis lupus familiaris]
MRHPSLLGGIATQASPTLWSEPGWSEAMWALSTHPTGVSVPQPAVRTRRMTKGPGLSPGAPGSIPLERRLMDLSPQCHPARPAPHTRGVICFHWEHCPSASPARLRAGRAGRAGLRSCFLHRTNDLGPGAGTAWREFKQPGPGSPGLAAPLPQASQTSWGSYTWPGQEMTIGLEAPGEQSTCRPHPVPPSKPPHCPASENMDGRTGMQMLKAWCPARAEAVPVLTGQWLESRNHTCRLRLRENEDRVRVVHHLHPSTWPGAPGRARYGLLELVN